MLFLALPMTLSHVSKKVSWSNSLNFKNIVVTLCRPWHMLSLLLLLDFASQTWRRKQVSTPSSFAASSIYRAYWCKHQSTDDCWHQPALACAHRGSTKELVRVCHALARAADPPYNLSWHLEEPLWSSQDSGHKQYHGPVRAVAPRWEMMVTLTINGDQGEVVKHIRLRIYILRQNKEDLLMYWNWGERESQVWHEN